MRRALAVAGVLACLLAPGAQAHFGTAKLGYRSTIESVKPRVPGAQLKVLYGDDQVWLDNRSGETVVINGYGGEPYLRFAPKGIFVNINSPAVYLNEDRYGKATVPKSASPEAAPNWKKLAGGNVWAWHDHRIHYMSPTLPPLISAAPDKPHHVFDWEVPRRRTASGSPSRAASTTRRRRKRTTASLSRSSSGRGLDRRRAGRPVVPPPRARALSGVDNSILPSARRMSSTFTSSSSPSR